MAGAHRAAAGGRYRGGGRGALAAGIAAVVGAALAGRWRAAGTVLGAAGLVCLVALTVWFGRRDAPRLALSAGPRGAALAAAAGLAFGDRSRHRGG